MPAVTLRSRDSSRVRVAALVLTLGLPTVAAAAGLSEDAGPSEGQPPENGDTVSVTGQVTDAQGRPLAGVHVVFEVFRSSFSLRHLERRNKDFRRVETVSGDDGRYRLEWRWDDYFNRFRVGVRMPGDAAPGDDPELPGEADLGRRLRVSGTAVVPLVIENTEILDAVRRFEASIETDDQRRVYHDRGYPDEVQVLDERQGRETSWWYFERGEVYRFVGGALQEVESFQPVRRF